MQFKVLMVIIYWMSLNLGLEVWRGSGSLQKWIYWWKLQELLFNPIPFVISKLAAGVATQDALHVPGAHVQAQTTHPFVFERRGAELLTLLSSPGWATDMHEEITADLRLVQAREDRAADSAALGFPLSACIMQRDVNLGWWRLDECTVLSLSIAGLTSFCQTCHASASVCTRLQTI